MSRKLRSVLELVSDIGKLGFDLQHHSDEQITEAVKMLRTVNPEMFDFISQRLAAVPVQDVLTTPGKHFIPLTGKPPCPICGQPEGIQLTVGATGFSCGTGFEHKSECAANFCPHGVRWTGDCSQCDADHYDEEGDEDINDGRR